MLARDSAFASTATARVHRQSTISTIHLRSLASLDTFAESVFRAVSSSSEFSRLSFTSTASVAVVVAIVRKRRSTRPFGRRFLVLPLIGRSATFLEEAPARLAEEAIKAAVAAADLEDAKDTLAQDAGLEHESVSFVSRLRLDALGPAAYDETDEHGLPTVYNVKKLNDFWGKSPGELAGRWGDLLSLATPWLSKFFAAAVTGRLSTEERGLAREAVHCLQILGPTFIKLGQLLSIRPDVLSPAVMQELGHLQDNIATFSSDEARSIIESELGRPLEEVFDELSEEPVAAASLAQVYKGKLLDGSEVAVKVQRPGALTTVSKDLWVMRKGAGVLTALTSRFTRQITDWKKLVEIFGEGLYMELDFRNEAMSQIKMKELIDASPKCQGVVVPDVYLEHCSRRVLVSQWMDGTKISLLPPEQIQAQIGQAQELFLNMLLNWGFFHGDPHPGNLLVINSGPDEGKMVLLDFGLVAKIPERERDFMVTAVIHVGTKNWEGLVDDFMKLQFLPADCDRALVIRAMQKVLSPYLRGGGARSLNFSALGQDLLQATLEIPFSIPAYISLLARGVATLEGIALAGNPKYQLIGEAYPFVVRKLLEAPNGSGRPKFSALLREILIDPQGRIQPVRLSALLQAAVGVAAKPKDQDGFIDFDAVPQEGAEAHELVDFLMSSSGRALKPVIVKELAATLDLVFRSTARRAYHDIQAALRPSLPFFGPLYGALPIPTPQPILPVLTLSSGLKFLAPEDILDVTQPKLSEQEEIFLQSSSQVFLGLLGIHVDPSKGLDLELLELLHPQRVMQILTAIAGRRDDEMKQVFSQMLSRRQGRGLLTEWWQDMFAELQEVWSKRLARL